MAWVFPVPRRPYSTWWSIDSRATATPESTNVSRSCSACCASARFGMEFNARFIGESPPADMTSESTPLSGTSPGRGGTFGAVQPMRAADRLGRVGLVAPGSIPDAGLV